MAKSLDDLVDFLLDEIALDSGRGASIKDIVRYTTEFYAQPYNASSPPTSVTLHPANTRIDKTFISQVWKWLTRLDDLRVGRNDEYHHSSLDEIEFDFPDVLIGVSSTPDQVDISANALSTVVTSGSSRIAASQPKDTGPRIYANQHRIYQAVCGHDPDPSRVSELEFTLLCTIGAARHDGILQGELGRIAKQDKRSVPKRTDALQAKGYIEKLAAYNKGHKTSRILLRRFADGQTVSHASEPSIRLGDLAQQILTVLKENSFTSQDDLASHLSILEPARRQVLNKVVQHLIRRGCVKRVKIAFAPDSTSADLRPRLQYVRTLEPSDNEMFNDDIVDLNQFLHTAVASLEESVDNEGEDYDVVDGEITSSDTTSSIHTARPSWNPERALPNAVYDLATVGGDDGITNIGVRQQITGMAVRRPAEALLVRLSHAALKAQPSVGRDLTLVRTTEVEGGVHRFVHRTLDSYHDMVAQGDLTWSATDGGSNYARRLNGDTASNLSVLSGTDAFGFSKDARSNQQRHSPGATLEDIARVPGPDTTVTVRPGETILTKDHGGDLVLSTKPDYAHNSSLRRSNSPRRPSCIVTLKLKPGFTVQGSTNLPNQDMMNTEPKSKPRMFQRGTHKFWSHVFWMKKAEVDPAGDKVKQATLMTDPDCLQMFADRPDDFDSLLMQALKQDLPVPHDPTGISEAWTTVAKKFLERTRPGLFYMPSGLVGLQQEKWSCPIVIKSTRLGEVNTTHRSHHRSVLFLCSSAAHTFRLHHVPQQDGNGAENVQATLTSVMDISDPANQQVEIAPNTRQEQQDKQYDRVSHPDSTRGNSLVVTLVLPKSSLRHSSSHDERKELHDSFITSPSRLIQREVTKRQRRPTRKAVESATIIVSERSTPESVSSPSPTPHDSYTSQESITEPVLLPDAEDSATNNDIQHDMERSTIHRDTALDADVTPFPEPLSQRKKTPELSSHNFVETRHLRTSSSIIAEHDDDVFPQIMHAANNSIQHQADDVSSPVMSTDAETNLRNGPNGPIRSTKESNLTATAAFEVIADSAEPATETSEPPPASTQVATLTTDPNQLTLLVGRDAVPYYRKFVMELVYMCGGVVPHDASLLKRAMGPKTIEAHVESNMNIKLIKTSISALTQSGKLKVMQFAFQKNGFNHTKAILALSSILPSDQLFMSMQAKISSLPANIDYVPPELELEANRKSQGILRTADSPGPESTAKSKPAPLARPKRQKKQSEVESRQGSTDAGRDHTPVEVSLNTGFLTLKVPRITEIRTDRLFTSKYFDLPAQPVIIDTSRTGDTSETGFPTASALRRNTVRNSRRASAATRKVQWRTPKYTPLPKSLRAILAKDDRVNQIDHALSINPALETFDRDIDFVAAWEQQTFNDLQEPRPQEWNFINHLSFRKEFVDTRGEGDLEFRLVTFNRLHEEVEKELPKEESWDVFVDILSKEAKKSTKANDRRLKRKRTDQEQLLDDRSDLEEDGHSDFMSSDGEAPKKKRQRGPTHKWRRKPRIAGTELDRRRQRRSYVKPRGVGLRDIPKAWAHRITTAIVVVRVLAGGLDKYLDWKLVARLIPDEPESVLQSRWRTLSTRYNNDFDAMVQDLQAKYLDALADDRVPSVNYNDLPGTNWEGIFEWAVVNINADNKGTTTIELPPNREDFLELVTAEVGETTSVRPLHNNSLQYTQATKEDFWCSMVSGTVASSMPLAYPKVIEPVFQTEEDETYIRLARARSWVFAAVMTPHQSFDPMSTHEKLRKLAVNEKECEELIDLAIKKLQNDKMVVTKDSTDAVIEATGTTLSGTYHWKLSTKFVDRFELNRHITSNILKQAVRYKLEVLDPTFARGDIVTIPGDPYLEDGVMVAIFNLMNAGMMRLEAGDDMTANRYGVDGGSEGYKTRSMDKRHLYFSVILRPTTSYTHGDLAIAQRQSTGIPRGDIDQADGMGLIPMWFDINHEFRPEIWDMVVGGITGLISCRPGVSNLELVRTLQYAISQKDMGTIVQYLYDCKLIQKTRSGWETTEIWWFAIGTGTGPGNGI